MKSDPFAPADHPLHAKNILLAAANGELVGVHASRFGELVQLHLTDHENRFDRVPDLQELERRETLVSEYRQQLSEEGPDAEPPTLVDLLNESYVWREGDRTEDSAEEPSGQPDGETSSAWVHVGNEEPAEGDPSGSVEIPPRNGPGSDTETWRAFAAGATLTQPSEWATMNRGEIIAHLEKNMIIPSDHA